MFGFQGTGTVHYFFSHWRLGTMTLLGLLGSVDVLDNLQISCSHLAYSCCLQVVFLDDLFANLVKSSVSILAVDLPRLSGQSKPQNMEISGPQILVVPEKLWKYMKHKMFPSPISGRSLIGFVASFWGPLWNHWLNMIKSIAYAVA